MKSLKWFLTLSFLLLLASVSAQNFDKTFIYGFKLPKELKAAVVTAKIKYNGKFLVPKNRWIAGKFQKIKPYFSYAASLSNKVENITLPIKLLPETYYWLFDADMVTEMAVHPNRYQIEISTQNSVALASFELPISFDFLSDNALNISYLKSLKTAERNNLLQQKTWTLSIAPKIKDVVKDTTLVYSINKLPKGVVLLIKDINLKPHSNQEFKLENVLYYKKELFFFVPTPKKTYFKKTHPDECLGKMTDINGNIGYASGCITGMGSGKCMGILKPNAAKKYNVTIIIEPN